MSSLLEGGKSRVYDAMVYLKDDDKIRIRLLDPDKPAKKVFIHSCKNSTGQFIEVLCHGLREGCKFCQENRLDKYTGLKNSELPHPGRTRYVKPVYVYDKNKVMLLGGKEVWTQIDTIHSMFGSAYDRDIIIMRKKTDRVTYIAQSDIVGPFTVKLDPTQYPKVEDYVSWLDSNVSEAVLVGDMQVAPTASAATQTGKSPQDTLMDTITDMLNNQHMNQAKVIEIMRVAAPGKSKFADFTIAELGTFIEKYTVEVESAKAKN